MNYLSKWFILSLQSTIAEDDESGSGRSRHSISRNHDVDSGRGESDQEFPIKDTVAEKGRKCIHLNHVEFRYYILLASLFTSCKLQCDDNPFTRRLESSV